MAEAENPPDDAAIMADLEDDAEGASSGILGLVWYYHPLIFLALSLLMAVVAYIMRPRQESFKAKTAKELYDSGLESLRRVMNVDNPLPAPEIEAHARGAYADFETLFKHRFRELPDHPEFINPYMLMAEASRLYARYLPLKRKERLEETLLAYSQAIQWEKRKWEQQAIYDRSNFCGPGENDIREDELAVRRRRRMRFLRYRQAVTMIRLGQQARALKILQVLQRELRREDVKPAGVAALGLEPAASFRAGIMTSRYIPHEFELVAEDRVLLHYYLAESYASLQQMNDAQREYQRFLLHAPRSREKFVALMRLGGMYMTKAESVPSVPGSKKGIDYGARKRRLLRIAADKYAQVVQASAPEDILREAYFRGGQALLAMAGSMKVGRKTWWDTFSAIGIRTGEYLKNFAGRELPERTRSAPVALGYLLLGSAVDIPSPEVTWSWGSLGAVVSLGSAGRKTRRARRDELLVRAEDYFDGAKGGIHGRFNAAARVMIANVLLARGQRDKARRLFMLTARSHPGAEVHTACMWGVAKAFLQDGKLDKARVRFIGGVENDTPAMLSQQDVTDGNWVELCRDLVRAVRDGKKKSGPVLHVWELLPAEVRPLIFSVDRSARVEAQQKTMLMLAFNQLIRRRDLYVADKLKNLKLPSFAEVLLRRDREAMLGHEVEWLNRMILESLFPRVIARNRGGMSFEGFPPARGLAVGLLVSVKELESDIQSLVHAYLQRADLLEADIMREINRAKNLAERESLSPAMRKTHIMRRRSLEDAARINEFLLRNYMPGRVDLLMETAEIYRRLASVVAAAPFMQHHRAQQFTAKSARTFLRVADQLPGTSMEEEALWQAGWGFFRAKQYGRSKETLQRYVEKYRNSDRAGIAQNLLGRAYSNLGELQMAAKVYRDNAFRHTPAGRKALCYLGWIYMALGRVKGADGKMHDLIGDPAQPLPQRIGGLPRILSALQAFNFVRQLPGLGPQSRPWRWATFGLGTVWCRIADRERERELLARKQGAKPRPDRWVGIYRDHALACLREAYNRYLLKTGRDKGVGIDPWTQPEDFGELTCARFITEYNMAKVQTVLAKTLQEPQWHQRIRDHLSHLIDTGLYPDVMFDATGSEPLYLAIAENRRNRAPRTGDRGVLLAKAPMLGVVEGPVYYPDYLRGLRREAFFLLGQNYIEAGERLSAEDPQKAQDAFRAAYSVYQAAHDRLPPVDSPQVMYLQGVCLQKMKLRDEAARKYTLVVNTARNLKGGGSDSLGVADPGYWASLASKRLQDYKDGF